MFQKITSRALSIILWIYFHGASSTVSRLFYHTISLTKWGFKGFRFCYSSEQVGKLQNKLLQTERERDLEAVEELFKTQRALVAEITEASRYLIVVKKNSAKGSLSTACQILPVRR